MKGNKGLVKWLLDIDNYGIGFVDGVPTSKNVLYTQPIFKSINSNGRIRN